MLSTPNILTLGALTFAIVPIILILYENRKYRLNKIAKEDNSYYKCIFITHENYSCIQHVYNLTPCGDSCSYTYLQTITNMLWTAKYSISMCVYHITLQSIRDELLEANLRSVHVRIISDREMEFNSGSKVPQLRQAGIEVKTQDNEDKTSFLHHKFCLIDEGQPSQIMWFGSLNLTMQGLCSNWDNIIMTDNPGVMSRFTDAFENLWSVL